MATIGGKNNTNVFFLLLCRAAFDATLSHTDNVGYGSCVTVRQMFWLNKINETTKRN